LQHESAHPSRRRPASASGRARRIGAAAGRRLALLVSAAAVAAAVLPASSPASAAGSPTPTLKQLLARAAKLSAQIDELSQQYDALRIQYTEAQNQLKIAKLAVKRDERILAADEAALAQIAAAGYMTGGMNPALQLLQSNNPQAMLNRASILTQLQQENGDKIKLVATAKAAAQRARMTAVQEARQATALAAAMRHKVAKIQAKVNVLNSAAFSQAMAVYRHTGKYPPIAVHGNSVGVQALRKAVSRIGAPYVWGAAGPWAFDCSGLVVWSYAQIGISLPHFTGDLWNAGIHVSRAQLEPGDLVFFFPDIGHVGIYMGAGMMINAPTFGQPVQVAPVFWSAYVGAVRIA
jgi:peptidoglycan DL-endopeptidase CwlO